MTRPPDITITLTRAEAEALFYSRPGRARPQAPHIKATLKLKAALQTPKQGEDNG